MTSLASNTCCIFLREQYALRQTIFFALILSVGLLDDLSNLVLFQKRSHSGDWGPDLHLTTRDCEFYIIIVILSLID